MIVAGRLHQSDGRRIQGFSVYSTIPSHPSSSHSSIRHSVFTSLADCDTVPADGGVVDNSSPCFCVALSPRVEAVEGVEGFPVPTPCARA